MKHLPISLLLAASLFACTQTAPVADPAMRAIGVVEIALDDAGKLSTAALLPNQDNAALSVSFSANAFVVTSSGSQKYLNAKFNVSNNSGASLQDLTLVAYRQSTNQANTAIKNLQNFAGLSSPQLDSYAQSAKPINGVNSSLPLAVNSNLADLQVFSEAETTTLNTQASSLLQSGEYLFPYGFVARATTGTSRSIPVGANTGTVTVGVNVPNSNEPSSSANRFTMTFIAFTQPVASRVTESVEEQGSSSASIRKTAFGATTLQVLGGSGVNATNRECQVRIAGSSASPAAYLVNTAGVTGFTPAANASLIAPNSTLNLTLDRSLSSLSASDIAVRGSLTGDYAGTWSGLGSSNPTFTPSAAFKPGETVRVTLKTGTAWCEARSWQFNTAVTPSTNASFGTKTDFTTGTGPYATLGDVNNDGKLDIVTVNESSSSSSVLLGNGNGTFQTKVDYPTGTGPYTVTLGDVNGDGKLDMVTANYGGSSGNTASVLLGTGGGAFGARTDYTTGSGPTSVALGEVNGDGRLDIVTTNEGSNSVSVLIGNGNGTFQGKTDYATAATPQLVALGDVNNDGKLDVVTSNGTNTTASVLLGNGDGTFRAKVDYATGGNSFSVALNDLNGDGNLDMVTTNQGTSTVSVLLGNGNGTFQAKVDYSTGSSPYTVAIGDVNGNGVLDVVTSNFATTTTSVLLGNGNGTLQAKTDFTTGSGPLSVSLGDLNGDGKLDLVTANYNSSNVSVLLKQ